MRVRGDWDRGGSFLVGGRRGGCHGVEVWLMEVA